MAEPWLRHVSCRYWVWPVSTLTQKQYPGACTVMASATPSTRAGGAFACFSAGTADPATVLFSFFRQTRDG